MQYLGLLTMVAVAVQLPPAYAAPLSMPRDVAVQKRLTGEQANEFTALMLQGIAQGELAAAGERNAAAAAAAGATSTIYAKGPLVVIEEGVAPFQSAAPSAAEPAAAAVTSMPVAKTVESTAAAEGEDGPVRPTVTTRSAAAATESGAAEGTTRTSSRVSEPAAATQMAEPSAPVGNDPNTALLTSSLAAQQASILSEEALLASELGAAATYSNAANAYQRRSYTLTSFAPYVNAAPYVNFDPTVLSAYAAANPALFRSAKFGQGLRSASVASQLDSGIAQGEQGRVGKRQSFPYGDAIVEAPVNPLIIEPYYEAPAEAAATEAEAAVAEAEVAAIEAAGATEGRPAAGEGTTTTPSRPPASVAPSSTARPSVGGASSATGIAQATSTARTVAATSSAAAASRPSASTGASAASSIVAGLSAGLAAGEAEVGAKRAVRPMFGLAAANKNIASLSPGYPTAASGLTTPFDPAVAAAVAASYNPVSAAALNPAISAAVTYAPIAQAAAVNEAVALNALNPITGTAPTIAAESFAASEDAIAAQGAIVADEVASVSPEAAPATSRVRRRRNATSRARALKALERRSPTAAVAADDVAALRLAAEKRALLDRVRQIVDESAVLLPVVDDMIRRINEASSLPVGRAFPLRA